MNVTGELSGAGGAPAHELMPATMYGEHGLTREEVLGKTSVELGLWEDPGLRAQYAERLARERVILDLEFPGYHKNGQRQVSQLSSALVTVNGEPCVLTIAHDITERRLAEQEVERSHQQLRALAAGLQRAREDERTMIAREIHDELGQALTGLRIDLAWLRSRIGARNPQAAERLGSALERIDGALNAVRRIATELRPSVLDTLRVSVAIEWQAREFQRLTGLRVLLRPPREDLVVTPDQATTMFRILQESLTNVAHHANASAVEIRCSSDEYGVELTVTDDGRGIAPQELAESQSLGILGMRERAIAGGGTLTIEPAPAGGTCLTAQARWCAQDSSASWTIKPASRSWARHGTATRCSTCSAAFRRMCCYWMCRCPARASCR